MTRLASTATAAALVVVAGLSGTGAAAAPFSFLNLNLPGVPGGPAVQPPADPPPAQPPAEVVPVLPVKTPADARTHGLESLKIATQREGIPLLKGRRSAQVVRKYVKNVKEAIRLGKALFFDMQLGGDGVQACVSCHFHAGADPRTKNQISPGLLRVKGQPDGKIKGLHNAAADSDTGFQVHQPDQTVTPGDFPFVTAVEQANHTNDVMSSMGVKDGFFLAVHPGQPMDDTEPRRDSVFSSAGENTRRVEPRNTPTVINAILNYANFWDGRANFNFNGRNPFGHQDPTARVLRAQGGRIVQEKVQIPEGSVSSQFTGPPQSNNEMHPSRPAEGNGRTWMEIGHKMVGKDGGLFFKRETVPLAYQRVRRDDSVLGIYSKWPFPGLRVSYADMIKRAFKPQYWRFPGRKIVFDNAGVRVVRAAHPITRFGLFRVLSGDPAPDEKDAFTLMEANFSLLAGLAVGLYEATLVSDQTPFDRWMETGRFVPGFGQDELDGLNVFVGKGRCIACHRGSPRGDGTFTNASVYNIVQNPRDSRVNNLIEPMRMANVNNDQTDLAIYDNGYYNIGVTPTKDDLGRGNSDPNGKPLASSRQALMERVLEMNMGFRILGNDRIPAVDEEGNVVCTDTNGDGFCDPGDTIAKRFQRANVDGTFKTPNLRNVKYTGPFFHNGSIATVRDVVEFYNRGGNFCKTNRDNLDPDIQPLGLTGTEVSNLVKFLVNGLTDPRVGREKAPFDHPEYFVADDGTDDFKPEALTAKGKVAALRRIEAVGRRGRATELKPFLGLDPLRSTGSVQGLCDVNQGRI